MKITDIPLGNLVKAPFKFNGSIFKWNNQNYLAYRANWNQVKCKIYIAKTDVNWKPLGAGWEIKVPLLNNLFEDPRFISINNKPYLAVSQIDLKSNCQFQGLIALNENLFFKKYIKINYGDNWSIAEKQSVDKQKNIHFINFNDDITFEKNWCFLQNEKQPVFIYKTQPVTTLVSLDNEFNIINVQSDIKNFNWSFGEIRGGAPAIKVGNTYYHFFHSSCTADAFSRTYENGVGRVYYIGCYTFKNKDGKFEVLSQSRIPLEMGNYTEKTALWFNAAVFPCGVVYENNEFKVSYGWHDYKLKLLTINKKELDNLLTELKKPVHL